jgi:hypothetical protein
MAGMSKIKAMRGNRTARVFQLMRLPTLRGILAVW